MTSPPELRQLEHLRRLAVVEWRDQEDEREHTMTDDPRPDAVTAFLDRALTAITKLSDDISALRAAHMVTERDIETIRRDAEAVRASMRELRQWAEDVRPKIQTLHDMHASAARRKDDIIAGVLKALVIAVGAAVLGGWAHARGLLG